MIAGRSYQYILEKSLDIRVQILRSNHLANGFEDTGERMDVSVEIGDDLGIVLTLLISGDEHVSGAARCRMIDR